MFEGPSDAPNPRATRMSARVPGIILTIAVALLALLGGRWLPLIGGPVFAIVLGILVRGLFAPGPKFAPGIALGARHLLQWSIVALGFGLSLDQLARTGLESLPVTLVTITVAFVSAWCCGRWLRVAGKLTILIGVGTAICGASAIAATAPIIRPDEHETAIAVSTIFLFNVAAVLLFPLLGHAMQLSDLGFGLWAGTAINDTSSVVAASYSYSHAAGDYATIVKLTRATLIIPVCVVLALAMSVRDARRRVSAGTDESRGLALVRIFPWFILWFVLASVLRTAGLIPVALQPLMPSLAQILIVLALAAIGLSADVRAIAASGARPILLGLVVWIAVAASSLLAQSLIGKL